MTATTAISRGARRFLGVGLVALVAWQTLAAALPATRRLAVVLGLYGFVFFVLFGKAYSLVPGYFDRTLATPRALSAQLPLSTGGVALLAADALGGPAWTGTVGALAWAAGVAVFVAALAWTLRGNLSGAATGTSEANADRERVDRLANAVVPVALGYLLVGAALDAAVATDLLFVRRAAITHLLAAGVAALMIFGVGSRLFPRFAVATPPTPLVAVVLATGAVGPGALAVGLHGSLPALYLGAAAETTAVVGFALLYATLSARSEKDRVGLRVVRYAVVFGAAGTLLGAAMAVGAAPYTVARSHVTVNVLGFLGLTVVGALYQFYPPAVGTFPGATDRGARAAALVVAAGVGIALLAGLAVGTAGLDPRLGSYARRLGNAVAAVGAVGVASLVLGVLYERHWSG